MAHCFWSGEDYERSWSILFDSLYSCTDVVSECHAACYVGQSLISSEKFVVIKSWVAPETKHSNICIGQCLDIVWRQDASVTVQYFMFYRKFNLVSALQMWWQNVGIKMRYDSVEICIWKPTLSSAILGNRFQFSNYQNLDWFQF